MVHPLKGKKQSPEHIAKRMVARRWYDKSEKVKNDIIARNKSRTGIKHTEEHKAKISAAMKGKRNSLGVKRSLAWRKHLSDLWTDNPKHNNWIDGKSYARSSKRIQEMQRLEYRLWRTAVFERDKFTCQICHKIGGKIEADHIKPYLTHPELRLNIDNGRVLCKPCHLKITNEQRKNRTFPVINQHTK